MTSHNRFTPAAKLAGLSRDSRRWSLRISDEDDERARELARRHGVTLAEWVRMRATSEGAAEKPRGR